MLGFFGKLFFGFLAVVLVLAILGFFLKRRDAKNGIDSGEEEVLSQKAVSNVADLNDDFNRARYMDQDGRLAAARS